MNRHHINLTFSIASLALASSLTALTHTAQAEQITAPAEMAPVPKTAPLGSVRGMSEALAEDRERILNAPIRIHNNTDYAFNMLTALYLKAKSVNASLTKRAFVLALRDKGAAGDVEAGYQYGAARLSKFGAGSGADQEIEGNIAPAMKAGKAEAERDYAVLHRYGMGAEKNPEKALALAKKSAAAGLASASALIGDFYRDGVGAKTDPVAAVTAWKKAADAGDIVGMLRYGEAATGGYGMDEDGPGGVAYLKKAADAGEDRALFQYGFMREMGMYGLTKDMKIGTEYIEKAAQAGNLDAQNIMGAKYARGAGVTQDDAYANMYYEAAALNGSAKAQMNFGLRMINGKGMNEDRANGIEWVKKSATQNYQAAIDALKELGVK